MTFRLYVWYVHLCTECNVGDEPIPSESEENHIEKREKSACPVQPTKRKTTRGEVPTIQEFFVKQRKVTYFLEAITQVRI